LAKKQLEEQAKEAEDRLEEQGQWKYWAGDQRLGLEVVD
jgi:hypothetical protein